MNVKVAEVTQKPGPPDLLRRFVPTPFRANLSLDSAQVLVETNDADVLMALEESASRSPYPCRRFRWKIVGEGQIDVAASAPVLLRNGPVVTVSMGPACLIAVDYEKDELLAFLGLPTTGEQFKRIVFPLMCDLTNALASTYAQQAQRLPRHAVIGGSHA